MNTLEIKQQLLQFIEESDEHSIMKFYELFKNFIKNKENNALSYTVNGKTLTKEQYKEHLEKIEENIKKGGKTHTSKEIKKFILNK